MNRNSPIHRARKFQQRNDNREQYQLILVDKVDPHSQLVCRISSQHHRLYRIHDHSSILGVFLSHCRIRCNTCWCKRCRCDLFPCRCSLENGLCWREKEENRKIMKNLVSGLIFYVFSDKIHFLNINRNLLNSQGIHDRLSKAEWRLRFHLDNDNLEICLSFLLGSRCTYFSWHHKKVAHHRRILDTCRCFQRMKR